MKIKKFISAFITTALMLTMFSLIPITASANTPANHHLFFNKRSDNWSLYVNASSSDLTEYAGKGDTWEVLQATPPTLVLKDGFEFITIKTTPYLLMITLLLMLKATF